MFPYDKAEARASPTLPSPLICDVRCASGPIRSPVRRPPPLHRRRTGASPKLALAMPRPVEATNRVGCACSMPCPVRMLP
ncbi:hypothetical protein VTN02DRAFT_2770 [Thermoascus thermophilus]